MTKEVTTTANVPSNYFPDRRNKRKDSYVRKTRTKNEVKDMNEALFAVELVERYGLDHRDALDIVLEQDDDKAAAKMAKKAAPDDPDKQKELESKYKEQMKKRRAKK